MDTVLGLIGLALYVLAILALSAGVTFHLFRYWPTRTPATKTDKP
jgi:hypothetical protein